MLRLILSPSVGSTAGYLYDTAASIASSGGEAVLMVPEQYSFAAERIVLERLGTADAQRRHRHQRQTYAGNQKAWNRRPYSMARHLSHVDGENQVASPKK